MKTLKQLYEIALKNSLNTEYSKSICSIITETWHNELISECEFVILLNDLSTRKPNIFSRFWWNKDFNQIRDRFWWKLNEEGQQQRIKFLEHIISKL